MTTTLAPRELLFLSNDAIRARHRPYAIGLLWAWQTALGIVAVWPLVAAVNAAYGSHPKGDAPLFSPGALPLLDLLVHSRRLVSPLVVHAGLVVAVAVALGLVPTAAVLASLMLTTRRLKPPPLFELLVRALVAFQPMALVLLVTTLLEVSLVFAGVLLGGWVETHFYVRWGEARAEQAGWAAAAMVFLLALVAGVVEDVARAGIVRFRVRALPALILALRTFGSAPFSLSWSWAWRTLASLVPVAFGSLVAERIGGRGGVALVWLAVVHQTIILSRTALRVSWLARAMRAVDAHGTRSPQRVESPR